MPSRLSFRLAAFLWLWRAWAFRRWWYRIVFAVRRNNFSAAAGLRDIRLHDEYYYQLKFAARGKVTPLVQADIDGKPETIAWAFQRPDGGRSFGFGGMHFHDNWQQEVCRRLVAQGVLWTLGLPIPKDGLPATVGPEDLKIR